MKKLGLVALILGVVGTAYADPIQKDGPEAWPGRVMIGVDPLGVQATFTDLYGGYAAAGDASYKLGINVEGLLASTSALSIWLGGEFNIGGHVDLAGIEPGIFVQLTMEKLVRFPLVPMVTAGLSFPITVPYGFNGENVGTGVSVLVKVGAGAYYFLTRHIGLGAETHFAFGPGFYTDFNTGARATVFSGYWDFLAGAKFAL